MNDSFAFIGAGDASYFEWAEVHVRFTRPPTDEERARIAAAVPPPIADLTWSGPLLSASSEQGVGRQIRAAYSGKKLVGLTTTSRFSAAAPSAVQRFNDDIERWLRAAHDVVAVLVAYRRQDAEAGGTTLSSWHHSSVARLGVMLRTIVAQDRASDGWLLTCLLEAADEAQVVVDDATRSGVGALEQRREAEADAAREAEGVLEDARRAAQQRQLDERTTLSATNWLDDAARDAALVALASTLPKFHKRLLRLDRSTMLLRPGASTAAIDDVERALGLPLLPDHRALLQAFDGGIVGDVVVCGTTAGGATGRHNIVEASAACASHQGSTWAVNVANRSDGAVLMARLRANKVDCFVQATPYGVTLKAARSLDALLDFVLKPR